MAGPKNEFPKAPPPEQEQTPEGTPLVQGLIRALEKHTGEEKAREELKALGVDSSVYTRF